MFIFITGCKNDWRKMVSMTSQNSVVYYLPRIKARTKGIIACDENTMVLDKDHFLWSFWPNEQFFKCGFDVAESKYTHYVITCFVHWWQTLTQLRRQNARKRIHCNTGNESIRYRSKFWPFSSVTFWNKILMGSFCREDLYISLLQQFGLTSPAVSGPLPIWLIKHTGGQYSEWRQ